LLGIFLNSPAAVSAAGFLLENSDFAAGTAFSGQKLGAGV
jgi:hypothetical protein